MNKREEERLKKEVQHMMWEIELLTKTITSLTKLGWSYNTDFIIECHNKRAVLMGQIEQKTDYEWLPKIWKNGKCVVHNRKDYLAGRKSIVLRHWN